jgi:hypothetical protein
MKDAENVGHLKRCGECGGPQAIIVQGLEDKG